jgi:alkanesulfonate monooxygenase
MMMTLPDRNIDVFAISPRTTDTAAYWKNIENTIAYSDKYQFTGNLIFTGNDIYVEAWLLANEICHRSGMSPLVAVNPLYMHPFTVAKMITSLGYLYKRKTYINFVTGTSKNDLTSLNDNLTHDQRYDRLTEYITIVKTLLNSHTPVSFSGVYYTIQHLQLRPMLPPELFPEFYIAGASESAMKAADAAGAVKMKMAYAGLDTTDTVLHPQLQEGIYMGIVTRPSTADACQRMQALFPDNPEGGEMLDFSMNNTDAVWKKQLHDHSKEAGENNGFSLQPFKHFQADCPYYTGSYEDVGRIIAAYVRAGVKAFILDVPCYEEEYRHIHEAFTAARTALLQHYDQPEPAFNFNF